jgi:hypothetical protein
VKRASELLDELPPDYSEPRLELQNVSREGPADWSVDVQAARELAAKPDHAGILSATVGYADISKPVLCSNWDRYLRDTWGWGLDDTGAVLMPHWSSSGELTGCKVRRRDGSRASLGGSSYRGPLYGAWLGRRHRDVLVTEGETDAAYAGWQAMQGSVPIDVFALPGGAGAEVEPAWLKFLKPCRSIYLAFDPDPAGVAATRRWIATLADAGFRDVRICSLPLGRDLRAAKPDLRTLLGAATTPLTVPETIVATNEGFFHLTTRGKGENEEVIRSRVTTWTVDPVARLAGGDEPGFYVTLTSRGTSRQEVLRLADIATVQSLNKWANRHGYVYTGRDNQRQALADWIDARGSVTPEVFQTDRVGMHAPTPEYSFAGPSVVYPAGHDGQLPWRYAPSARAADVSGKILLPTSGAFQWRWLVDFLDLNERSVTEPLLAWIVASARRSEVTEFPILFIGGSSGTGKSTLARLACRLAGSKIELDLGANTPYILLRTIAGSASLPVFVDEWTRLSRRDSREALQGAIPVLYTGGNAERGTAELTTAVYKLTAPTIIAGEDTFMLARERERMSSLSLTRAGQNRAALARIKQVPLERFGQLLNGWLAQPDLVLPELATVSGSRPEYNREILRAGWQTLHTLLEYVARYEEVPDIADEPDLTALDKVGSEETENVYYTALIECASFADQNHLPLVWEDPEGRGTWARFQVLVGEVRRRQLDVDLPGGSRAMRAYFEELYGECSSAIVIPPGHVNTVRANLIPGLQLTADGV